MAGIPGPKYTEEYIADLKRWDSDDLYSCERIKTYYKDLHKGVAKYFRRREYYYNIYIETCKTVGVKPKFALESNARPHSESSLDDRASFYADEIVKFIGAKQTINDIIEENNKLVRQHNEKSTNKIEEPDSKQANNISIQINFFH